VHSSLGRQILKQRSTFNQKHKQYLKVHIHVEELVGGCVTVIVENATF
jgi:hypothetical protein